MWTVLMWGIVCNFGTVCYRTVREMINNYGGIQVIILWAVIKVIIVVVFGTGGRDGRMGWIIIDHSLGFWDAMTMLIIN